MNNFNYDTTNIFGKDFIWGDKTYIMGVINVTPDSFSGDGIGDDINLAIEKALSFEKCGVDIIDIGGESTRPASVYKGVKPVSEKTEIDRVIPVISELRKKINIPISIDTYKPRVALKAIEAGANMVNDISGFRHDPEMIKIIAETGLPVILMHNQQDYIYNDLIGDINEYFINVINLAISYGIKKENIIIDPGIGFGKNTMQNLEIYRNLDKFKLLDHPVLVGMSRKASIGEVLNLPIHDRIEGTSAVAALCISKKVDIIRVHDVCEIAKVAKMSDAIVRGW
ncbi:MAG: dihydropteroate synthase [Chloroflexi bacterium]|nr:dihydropteroate synthase [Chloroflexota bacterium]|tara:strand:- start:9496 stop:10344 length:849 start_codon:yes stop_codon:yes gene_type:complete